MYRLAFARPPTERETSDGLDFLRTQSEEAGIAIDDPRVWADLAHTLFNVKEFVFVK